MRPKRPMRPPSGFPAAHLHAEAVPRPVAAMADSLPRGTTIPFHSHGRAQLIFAVSGTMTVRASASLWILPASHALWMPPKVMHQIRTAGRVEMRTLYIAPAASARVGDGCRVMFVSPLLRELIMRAMEVPPLYDEQGMAGRVMDLILDEIACLPAQPLSLRMPKDARLAKLCERALADLSKELSIAQLGASVGLSERSVIRLFPKETGLSFGKWLSQARLLKAFEMFEDGQSVTRVALELGYSSPSAFSKMVRRTIGRSPAALR